MVAPTRALREALRIVNLRSPVEQFKTHNTIPMGALLLTHRYVFTTFAMSCSSKCLSCDFQLDYANWSAGKARMGKGWTDVQEPVFEVPIRDIVVAETAKVDPISGKKTKEHLAQLIGFAKEVRSRKLVPSAVGEHWVDTVELVPVTHHMEANMQVFSENLKKRREGYVSTLLNGTYILLLIREQL